MQFQRWVGTVIWSSNLCRMKADRFVRLSAFFLCASMSTAENGRRDLVRFRDSGLRSSAASADAVEIEKLLRTPPSNEEKVFGQEAAGAEEGVKLRNMDTGEDIALEEIKDRVPPSLDPGELFRSKDVP